MKTYKDLKVWQINQECIKQVLNLADQLPKHYAFEHVWKQLFRAITSVGANIAEGQDSHEGKEFSRYINISIRSAIESDHWFATLKNILHEKIEHLEKIEAMNVEAIKMLKGLLKSIEEKRQVD